MAVKPKDLKFEEAALLKRLEFVRDLKRALQDPESVATQTINIYSSLMDEIIKEVALEVHRAIKTGVDDLSDVFERHRESQVAEKEENTATVTGPLASPLALGVQMSGSKGGVDMFGNQIQPIALDQVSCPSCGRHVAAGRFAPHLEKCMLGGRLASRVRRIVVD